MLQAIIIPLYLIIGLLSARYVYRWRVAHGKHDGYYIEEEGTFFACAATFFAWPVWFVIGLGYLAYRFVTANPPKSPHELEKERTEMQEKIDRLERELGVKKPSMNEYREYLSEEFLEGRMDIREATRLLEERARTL